MPNATIQNNDADREEHARRKTIIYNSTGHRVRVQQCSMK